MAKPGGGNLVRGGAALLLTTPAAAEVADEPKLSPSKSFVQLETFEANL